MLLTWLIPRIPFVLSSRATAVATSWIMMVDRVSEIVIIMADPVSCWHLIVVVDHDRQLMMDPDGGSG